MNFKLEANEQEAWDGAATAVLQALVNDRAVSADGAAKIAAGFADELVKERRKRKPDPKELPTIRPQTF